MVILKIMAYNNYEKEWNDIHGINIGDDNNSFKNMKEMVYNYNEYPNREYILSELETFLDKYKNKTFYLMSNKNKFFLFDECEMNNGDCNNFKCFNKKMLHKNNNMEQFYEISKSHENFHIVCMVARVKLNFVY